MNEPKVGQEEHLEDCPHCGGSGLATEYGRVSSSARQDEAPVEEGQTTPEFAVWYFSRHFLGKDITLAEAKQSLHAECLVAEWQKYRRIGKLLDPAFVSSPTEEAGMEKPERSGE